jgi:hypothetical protein
MQFTTQGVIQASWEYFKQHWGILLSALFVIFAINVAFGLLMEQDGVAGGVFSIASLVVGLLLQLGLMRIALHIIDSEETSLQQLFMEYPLILRYIGASLLFMVAFVIGLMLLIIPGIYVGIMLSQYRYFILDKDMGIIESLKKSAEVTKGNKLKLFGFWLLLGLLIVLSALPFGLGLFVTIPMSVVAGAIVYRRLVAANEATDAPESTEQSGEPEAFVPLGEEKQQAQPAS